MGKTRNGETADGGTGGPPLAQAAAQAVNASGRRGPPPVHLWNPPHCGHSRMRILRDGAWLHEGTPIGRPALVRLFASILRRDPHEHVLVTPAERMTVDVDDTPFLAVDVEATPDGLLFATNLGDAVLAGPGHAVEARDGDGPTLHVRHGLLARLDRKTYLRLVDLCDERDGRLLARSAGATFDLGPL